MDIKLRDDAVLVADGDGGAEFVSLQPVGLVDHVASMTDESALKRIIQGDEIGGSRRVDMQEVQRILGDCSMPLLQVMPWHSQLQAGKLRTDAVVVQLKWRSTPRKQEAAQQTPQKVVAQRRPLPPVCKHA